MNAQNKNNALAAQCTVTPTPNGYHVVGNFHALLNINDQHNELDQIEKQINQIGQQLKRNLCQTTLETADQQYVQLLKKTQPALRKNGKAPFTIVTTFGEVPLQRQRMLNPNTGTTITPSAIVWKTSQHRHLTAATIEAACETSQNVSYRKAATQLAEDAGEETLIAASTVWNKKQEKGRELQQQQNDFVEQVFSLQEVPPPDGVPSGSPVRRIEANTIQLQMDEVKTKSQEADKKMNLTYTATLETADGTCFYLVEKNSEQLIRLVLAHLTVLGLYLGKRLEVISDGASWIGDWVRSLCDVNIDHVLCWYHLRKRIYESLGALGFAKERRKLLEHEILGHLWNGNTASAIWLLWGLRSSARIPKRIDDLIGYLLRKRRMIVNYGERRAQGLWLASTRVEKWNDSAISERCKHRGMSWTSSGVLAVALFAAVQKKKPNHSAAQTAQINAESHTTS